MDQSQVASASSNQSSSRSLLGELDSLFTDLQGLLGTTASAAELKTGLTAQAAINEAGNLDGDVEYVSQQDGLKKELSLLQQREEGRLSQVRAQNVLLSLRKDKIAGTDGYSRTLDDAGQVRAQKKNVALGAPLEDESISEEQLFMHSLEDKETIERSNKTSPDFGEAFLGSSHDAYTQKEEQRMLDKYEVGEQPASEPSKRNTQFEKDEIIELDKLDQLFGEHLHGALNEDREIEGRILSISSQIDRKSGSDHSLGREIEKRIERIGQFIDKPNEPQNKQLVGKAFPVPVSKSVQRLRSKFGKM